MAYQKPAKLLRVTISGVSVAATYSGGDPWSGNAIRWNATLAVTAQPHSDPNTTAAYFYNGSSIAVGDFIASSGEGRILRVYSISAQNSTTVTCVLEDYNRINTFENPNQDGDGLIPAGTAYVFEIINGCPIMYPLPAAIAGTLPSTFATQIIARFLSSLNGGFAPYSQTFNATTDWGTAAGGLYTITIAASVHGKGTSINGVQVFEDDGTSYVETSTDVLKWNKSTGQVSISVSETPNGRFAGSVVIR